MKRILITAAVVLLLLGLTAYWVTKEPKSTQTINETNKFSLENVFGTQIFEKPVGLEHREGFSDLVYIIEQPGRIFSMNLKHPSDKPAAVLDITDRVYDIEGEQGLLGVAFHPKHPDQAYVNYTTQTHTVIARFDADPEQPERLDPASEQILFTFKQPYANHNGGQMAFGPDGYLYIATGDGGGSGDPHNNSQNLDSLLGKILRIDVDRQADGQAYAIPSDNPFIDQGAPEIYAYGLRNPWRFSFDEETGLLWVADVGQNRLEEINIVAKGKNYGWRIQEGTECFNPQDNCDKTGLEQPLFTYSRDLGVSITGGYVYRGKHLPELAGWYVYADYGTGTLWGLRQEEDGSIINKTLLESGANITSFGLDAGGELYICTQEGQILKLW
jgi:glucose/arabinose dehydrogenase